MSSHDTWMRRALNLAKAQAGRTGDNPSVGCVIVSATGKVLAEAATADGGRPHAEQLALEALINEDLSDATAYVTLEPCRERSTGEDSCSQRLVKSGIGNVIIATLDKHPKGHGGLDHLKANSIKYEIGVCEEDARALYADFFAQIT